MGGLFKGASPAQAVFDTVKSKMTPATPLAATVTAPHVAPPPLIKPDDPAPTATVDALGKAARPKTILTPPAATQTYGVSKLG